MFYLVAAGGVISLWEQKQSLEMTGKSEYHLPW